MVDTIQPREYFPISRILPDPADTATYYIRAVIRNAKTFATIDTINLTDQGSRIFSYNWQAPADPSGQGLFITITTLVYTDSGYTTKSDLYGEEQDTFLIYDRFRTAQTIAAQVNAMLGGGTSADIDYKKIRKIVDEAVAPIKAEVKDIRREVGSIEMPAMERMDFSPVIHAIQALKMPEHEACNHAEILEAVASVLVAIQTLKFPEQEKLDLGPVMGALEETKEAFQKIDASTAGMPDMQEVIADMREALKEIAYAQTSTGTQEKLGKIHDTLKELTYTSMGGKKRPGEQEVTFNRFGRPIKRTNV